MGKTLMILGAGVYQVPLIQKAKQLGLRTVAVSIPGIFPGFAYADEVCLIDTRDGDAVLRAAERFRIDGIVTTGTDVAVRTIGAVCRAMGLPGISAEAARIVTDKAEMKAAFKGTVRSSDFELVRSLAEAEAAARKLGYPVVMKACDVSGSRGITCVSSPEALEAAFAASVEASKRDYYIVEKYVEGHEIGLDAFVAGGRIVYAEPHEKYVFHRDGVTIPAGHSYPMEQSDALREEIHTQLERIVRSTGMDNCAINADLFLLPGDRISVIEAGGRCGATCIPELITLHTGIDYYAQMIRCALGEPLDFAPKQDVPCIAKLLFSDRNGKVTAMDEKGLEAVRQQGFEISIDVKPGDRVRVPRNGTDRIGHVIGIRKSEKELDEAIGAVLGCILGR